MLRPYGVHRADSNYRQVLTFPFLQVPEQHWPFDVQVEPEGWQRKQPEVLIVQEPVHERVPLAKPWLAQVWPPKSPPSQASEPSFTPLPQNAGWAVPPVTTRLNTASAVPAVAR